MAAVVTKLSSVAKGAEGGVAAAAPDPPNYEERCVGLLLWKACADTLGGAGEFQHPQRVAAKYPQGVSRFQRTGHRPFGCYSDDTQMALALATSLVQRGRLDPEHVSVTYAEHFEPWRGYGGTAHQILASLQQSEDKSIWSSLARTYFPEGSFANGGAMRIAPLGLAYRNASPEVLRRAVEGALALTHVHPDAIDGAVAIAAAAAWLCHRQPPTTVAEVQAFATALLDEVERHVQGYAMRRKLGLIRAALKDTLPQEPAAVPPGDAQPMDVEAPGHAPPTQLLVTSVDDVQRLWAPHQASGAWAAELQAAVGVAEDDFQIKAVDAVAVVLYCFTQHGLLSAGAGGCPAKAVVACCMVGGDADTTAAMAGALVGALHGYASCLPREWFEELENGHVRGRDGMAALGQRLAALDVRDA